MYKVTRELNFCYGHRLLNYDGKCAHPHGHNARVEIDLVVERLDERSMVTDFSDVKNKLGGWIESALDHQMLLRRDDPLLPVLQKMNEPVYVMDANPTAEAIAKTIFDCARSMHFPVQEVRVWETPGSVASYRG